MDLGTKLDSFSSNTALIDFPDFPDLPDFADFLDCLESSSEEEEFSTSSFILTIGGTRI